MKMDLQEQLNIAAEHIDHFSLDPAEYTEHKFKNQNYVYAKSPIEDVDVEFDPSASNCRVFIGANLEKGVRIRVLGGESLVYIGDDARLGRSWIEARANTSIIIGNEVSITQTAGLYAGQNAGGRRCGILIGDDCMLAVGITMRATDGHPIVDLNTLEQINAPERDIVIEPHVWLGQDVKVLKGAHIGACSIVALGAIVTGKIPRFSVAYGAPLLAQNRRRDFG
ncbi:MAG: acyltransferase [Thiotrichales bacterium]